MILSVSRRTDIPNYYSDWFCNRVREGFLYVRNPVNYHQISKIRLSPELVDCIVFWTKNPENMIEGLEELKQYQYYFQFTLTGYGRDIEPFLPDKRSHLIPVFQKLSDRIGSERVIWRYDPVLLNHKYTREYHLKAFEEIAVSLNGYTGKVVISFVDFYAKTKKSMEELGIRPLTKAEMEELAAGMVRIAAKNRMVVESCAERIDLQQVGVRHGSCIDRSLIEKLTGCKLHGGKDRNQRAECGCLESVEVGTYNTCPNGCRYCYAGFSGDRVKGNAVPYDKDAPLLCGRVGADDIITERKLKSLKTGQISLFES